MLNIAAQTTLAAHETHEAKGGLPVQRAAPRISSQELLGPHREVVIVHNGREYRLRQTQNGKLILTA